MHNNQHPESLPTRPWLPVTGAVAFILAVQLIAITGMRGVVDPEGYPLNTSQKFSLNVYEDDGIMGLKASLGYNRLYEDRFSYLFGIGGPVLHAAKPVMILLGRLGIISRFDQPGLYQMYPHELSAAYKAFAVYQLLAFTIWLPVVAYVLLSSHVSKAAGVWGAWLFALTPFLTGFEGRIKPDTPALLFGLMSLHFSLQHFKLGKERQHLLAWGLLGLSTAIKLTCVPFLGVLVWVHIARAKRVDERWLGSLLFGVLASVFIFIAANPLFLAGLGDIVHWLAGYMNAMHATPVLNDVSDPGLAGLAVKLANLQVFFGPVLRWAYPVLLAGYGAIWISRRFPLTAWSVLWVACLLQILYMLIVSGHALIGATYYHYTSASLGLLLLAVCLDRVQSVLLRTGQRAGLLANLVLCVMVIGPLVRADLSVLQFVVSPTNRQLCHQWISRNIPEGSNIGVPQPANSQPVSQYLQIDPFRYSVTPVGARLELLSERRPQYLAMVSNELESAPLDIPGYSLLANFDAGTELPRDQIGLFQDEIYRVYKCQIPPLPAAGPPRMELGLGNVIRRDREQGFAVLQYQALRFYPISLNLFYKSGQTLLPFPTGAFTGSLRHESSPVAYVHHVGPLALSLWGVKYIWAKQDGAFLENVIGGGYPVEAVEPPVDGSGMEGLKAYRFLNYRGKALFAPDEIWTKRAASYRVLWKRSLPRAGTLLDGPHEGDVEVSLEVDADGPVDVVLTGGPMRRSFLLGPGRNTLDVPYECGSTVEYEVNPVHQGDGVSILCTAARPLDLVGAPVVVQATMDPLWSFASVDAPKPGRVFFALPWHSHWAAEVDGSKAQAEPGPAGVVGVPVGAGVHNVSLRFVR